MEYRSLYAIGKEKLAAAGIPEADLDARLLLEYVCHTSRNDLLVHGDCEVAETEQQAYEQLLAKRAEHIPLQQLTGEQEFMGLTFSVNEHVLIPRQDTEVLVEEVMKNLHDGFRILDLCTGSGLHFTEPFTLFQRLQRRWRRPVGGSVGSGAKKCRAAGGKQCVVCAGRSVCAGRGKV